MKSHFLLFWGQWVIRKLLWIDNLIGDCVGDDDDTDFPQKAFIAKKAKLSEDNSEEKKNKKHNRMIRDLGRADKRAFCLYLIIDKRIYEKSGLGFSRETLIFFRLSIKFFYASIFWLLRVSELHKNHHIHKTPTPELVCFRHILSSCSLSEPNKSHDGGNDEDMTQIHKTSLRVWSLPGAVSFSHMLPLFTCSLNNRALVFASSPSPSVLIIKAGKKLI